MPDSALVVRTEAAPGVRVRRGSQRRDDHHGPGHDGAAPGVRVRRGSQRRRRVQRAGSASAQRRASAPGEDRNRPVSTCRRLLLSEAAPGVRARRGPAFGGMSKGERNRIKIRVRSAAQAESKDSTSAAGYSYWTGAHSPVACWPQGVKARTLIEGVGVVAESPLGHNAEDQHGLWPAQTRVGFDHPGRHEPLPHRRPTCAFAIHAHM